MGSDLHRRGYRQIGRRRNLGLQVGRENIRGVTGVQAEALIGCTHIGTAATSRLIWFQNTGVTGLPVTPDGRDIKVTPAGGVWFRL